MFPFSIPPISHIVRRNTSLTLRGVRHTLCGSAEGQTRTFKGRVGDRVSNGIDFVTIPIPSLALLTSLTSRTTVLLHNDGFEMGTANF